MFSQPLVRLAGALLTAIASVAIAPALIALPLPAFPGSQGGGSLGTDRPDVSNGSGLSGERTVVLTPVQQFAARLKLDAKTQAPAVEQILSDAQKEAAPVGQQMLQLRQQLVNLALANKAEETKPVVDAYTAAAAKMAGIEAKAFAKVYATLKPNQQSAAPQAFAIMAGMFQPSAPRGPAGRGPRGGGER